MRNIAIIVENRNPYNLNGIIESHLKHLGGWEYRKIVDQSIRTAADYNRLLTDVSFWEQWVKYDRVLIFQHDSMLLRPGIDDFLEFDYIGAPWKANATWARADRAGGNGGLSLRCPKKSLSLCREFPYKPAFGNEDVYFTHHLGKVGGLVAPYEICKRFACETEFQLGTLGYHAIEKHLTENEVNQRPTRVKSEM